jgi:hypothetical protein
MEILRPQMAFSNVDLPTFGLPTSVTKPDRIGDSSLARSPLIGLTAFGEARAGRRGHTNPFLRHIHLTESNLANTFRLDVHKHQMIPV